MSGDVAERGAALEFAPDARGTVKVRSRLRRDRGSGLLALGLLAAAGIVWYGAQWWQVGRFIETTDDAYVGGNVTTLSPHVAGFVSRILVRDNAFVHRGELLVGLDDRNYKAALAHAEAVVQQERAQLADLEARYVLQQSLIGAADADLAAKEATQRFTREDEVRYHALALSSFGSLQTYQKASAEEGRAQAAVAAARASRQAAKEELAVIATEIDGTRASFAEAVADRRTAELDLAYTEIRSPMDGYVADRAAEMGAYMPVGAALLAIVPAHGLWVDANFKEDELAHMRPGQPATIVADVLPDRVFTGRVVSLAPATGAVFSVIPPENATGNFTKIVQRVPVRIAVADGGGTLGLLRPGLSTTVSVDTRPTSGDRK
jgi:membrane fusion protein, multidrug efflux system